MIDPIYTGESKEFSSILKIDGIKLTKSELDVADDLIFVAKKDISLADGDPDTIEKTRGNGITTLAWTQESEPNLKITIQRADTKTLPTGTYHLGFAYIVDSLDGGLAKMKSSKGYFATAEIKESPVSTLKT